MRESERNHLQIGKLPNLRIVSSRSLRFHEEHDEARLRRLIEHFGRDEILKNPPIVGKAKGIPSFIILDGANRVTALGRLGIGHIPVHVVRFDDPRLVISCWHHAVERYGRDHFLTELRKHAGLVIREGRKADRQQHRAGGPLCTLSFRRGEGVSIISRDGLQSQVEHLRKITADYLNGSLADRVSYTDPRHLSRNYPDFQTLLTFRQFSKKQIGQLVSSRRKLPAGITRIILPKRVLGLNLSLEFLKSGLSLKEKNSLLDDMIRGKIAEKSIRFYQESTFIFDE